MVYPGQQCIFILKMVVEGGGGELAVLGDFPDGYLIDGLVLRQLLKRGSQQFFCGLAYDHSGSRLIFINCIFYKVRCHFVFFLYRVKGKIII